MHATDSIESLICAASRRKVIKMDETVAIVEGVRVLPGLRVKDLSDSPSIHVILDTVSF
jgi:hypothetical protein